MKRYIMILVTALSVSCGSKTTPPASIKSVAAIHDGNGVHVYFSLADKRGNPTLSTGTAHLLYELALKTTPGVKTDTTYMLIKEATLAVTAEEFDDVTIGSEKLYAYDLGRLPDSAFGNPPTWVSAKDSANSFGRIRLEFTQKNGGTFNGQTKYKFD